MSGGAQPKIEKASLQLQGESGLHILEALLKHSSRSRSIRDELFKVVVLSQRRTGQVRCRVIEGEPHGDCKDRLAYDKEKEKWPRGKAPIPMRTCPIQVKAASWATNEEPAQRS